MPPDMTLFIEGNGPFRVSLSQCDHLLVSVLRLAGDILARRYQHLTVIELEIFTRLSTVSDTVVNVFRPSKRGRRHSVVHMSIYQSHIWNRLSAYRLEVGIYGI